MHMADALLSTTVGSTMCVVSIASIAYSINKIKNNELHEKKIPIMAIAGAFIFAAQMFNFTIPGTGSSGHIGGGIMLAALIGGFPALQTISAVLIIQCLFFADGGLLALGCNIFNLGVIPCLLIYPLVFKQIVKNKFTIKTIYFASIISVIISLQLGAFSIVLQTQASGITELPFGTFAILMQSIHLGIGIIEGLITAAVLCFVFKIEPGILENANTRMMFGKMVSLQKIIIILVISALLTGGLLSIFASPYPDGLEWSIEKITGSSEGLKLKEPLLEKAEKIQEITTIMPGYDYKSIDNDFSSTNKGKSAAGFIGSGLTFLFAWIIAFIISIVKKKRKKTSA